MPKKLSLDFVKRSFESEGYTLLSAEYKNSKQKLEFLCPNNHQHRITFGDWSSGHRCAYCAGVSKPDFEELKRTFEKEGYVLLSTGYINSHSKLEFICPNGHIYEITRSDWLQKCRCGLCFGNNKFTIDELRSEFSKEGYTLVSNEYNNVHSKLEYLCVEGHMNTTTRNSWRNGCRCPTCYKLSNYGANASAYKGGVVERNIALYDTYYDKLSLYESTRRDPDENILLQVKCFRCGSWFTPKRDHVNNRLSAINKTQGGAHFYCSEECKGLCPIYKQVRHSKLHKPKGNKASKGNLYRVWSQEVLKRADYLCEICGKPAEHAHHIQPKKLEPGLDLDPDNGLALCRKCHYEKGHSGDCSIQNIKNFECNNLE